MTTLSLISASQGLPNHGFPNLGAEAKARKGTSTSMLEHWRHPHLQVHEFGIQNKFTELA